MNVIFSYSAGLQTTAEIEALRLRTPRPMAIYLCESEATAQHGFICAKAKSDSNNNNTQLNVQHHIGSKPLADVTDFEEELFEFTRKNPDTMTLEVINSDFLCF